MEQGPIEIRRINAGDGERLIAFYAALSPESRATRFMGMTRGISPAQAVAFANPHTHGADGFVAVETSTGSIVGHLCLEPAGAQVEEIGVAVADHLRGMGIGRELMKAAVASARRRGTTTFTATMLRGNRGIYRLLQRAGIPWRRHPVDSSTEELVLDVQAAWAA
jgi:GNAT superfamily N-acetyltransferase